jgi:hypothetical protein
MLGAKRRESLRSREAIDSASVQRGSSDRAGGGSVDGWTPSQCCRNIDTSDDSIIGFNRLTKSISLVDSVAYALKPFV